MIIYVKNCEDPLSSGYEGAIKRSEIGVSIFPTNIPYEMGSRLELLRVSQPSKSPWNPLVNNLLHSELDYNMDIYGPLN